MTDMTTMAEIDKALVRHGDTMSLTELSFKIKGVLTPEQCGARLAQILDAPDWLTLTYQDQLITHKMRLVIADLEANARTDRNGEVLMNALEKLGNRLEKRMQATEKDLNTLYAFQGGVLLDAVQAYNDYLISQGVIIPPALIPKGIRAAQLVITAAEEGDADTSEDEMVIDAVLVEE